MYSSLVSQKPLGNKADLPKVRLLFIGVQAFEAVEPGHEVLSISVLLTQVK